MKKLPIGIQTFEKIREDTFVYIDKTDHALGLIENEGGYFFLSRPRRFGKSLFLSTLRAVFENKKHLFEGLYIYDRYAWQEAHPVVHISFLGSYGIDNLKSNMSITLKRNQEELGIACEATGDHTACFSELIASAYRKYGKKVVVLIDEYDKGILDNIDDTAVAKEARELLRRFYSVLKDSDAYIRFVFITGVSKFSKVSLFSGLNNLQDITLDPRYATICGYTQGDIEHHFTPWFEKHAVDLQRVREWYNGYRWLGEGLYNPFGFLNFLANGCIFENYWFGTATPTFLLKLIERNHYYPPDFENIVSDRRMLDSFDVDHIELETLMWQSGYLTITEAHQGFGGMNYKLAIPNKEVRISLMNHLVDLFTQSRGTLQKRNHLYDALSGADTDALQDAISQLFAAIDYHNFTGIKLFEYEGYYASVLYSYLASLGTELISEDTTNKGRIDLTLRVPGKQSGALITYIFEFKVVEATGKVNTALEQIRARRYFEKYGGEVWIVGIEFGKDARNVVRFDAERAEEGS